MAPSWPVTEAVSDGRSYNWTHAYEEFDKDRVPQYENVIGSHIVFKIKCEENNVKHLKARLSPLEHCNKMKIHFPKDSTTAQFDVSRLRLSLATTLRFRLEYLNTKRAYL